MIQIQKMTINIAVANKIHKINVLLKFKNYIIHSKIVDIFAILSL